MPFFLQFCYAPARFGTSVPPVPAAAKAAETACRLSALTPNRTFTVPITDPTWIFFTVLAIILFAPMLLERLRIPSIVGMIFAGILIGPHGFGVLDRDGSFELFGKVGLYYIMFLASLEMNLQDVQRIKGRALALGLLGFAIPMLIGFFANTWILGYGAEAAVLIAAMYASHTLIAYPIVLRYGLSRLTSVSIAVGGTIVADTLTLLVLAVVGGMFKEQVTGLYWVWLVVKVVLLGLLIIYTFPLLGRWFFRRYDDSVAQYVFVLSLVFLGAGLMEMVGMEGILGAFLVGIVLNRLIPPTSPLMSHIEFVGNALFIPYFLIGVGMIINLRALVDHDGALLVAGVMVAVGLASKWLAAFFTQKMFRMSPGERSLMFGLTGSRAAATLAVVLVGYKIFMPDGTRLLGEDVLNGAMFLILVTCVVSSLVTENTARKLVLRQRNGNEGPEQPVANKPDRILIALNNPETMPPLVNLALMIRTPQLSAPILALNIVLEDEPSARQTGIELLQRAEKMGASTNVRIQTFSRWSVNVVSGISHTIKENAISDLVLGLHQKARLTESFYGKLGTDLLASIERQVLIFRATIPLNTVRHIQVLVPSKAEYEPGFAHWMNRLALLARQISCAIDVHGSKDTLEAMKQHWKRHAHHLTANFREYVSWNDFLPLAHFAHQEHLVVFVCARRGTISHHNYLDRMPDQIERYFSARSILLIYPEQPAAETVSSSAIRAGVPLKVR